VAVVRRYHTCQCQPERQRLQTMDRHCHCAVEDFMQLSHGTMFRINKDHIFEEIAVHHRLDHEVTDQNRRDSQQDQRQRHHPWRLVRLLTWCQTMMFFVVSVIIVSVMCMIVVMCVLFAETLFSVEYQEVHTERVERRNKYTCQHCEVGEARTPDVGGVHSFDNAVFRVEAREQWRTDQCQRTDQGSDPG